MKRLLLQVSLILFLFTAGCYDHAVNSGKGEYPVKKVTNAGPMVRIDTLKHDTPEKTNAGTARKKKPPAGTGIIHTGDQAIIHHTPDDRKADSIKNEKLKKKR